MSARLVVLSAALLLAAPARAYQQTRDSNTGKLLRWPTSTVSWFLNTCRPASSPSCQASATADPAAAAVQAGFLAWQGATRAGDSAPCSGIRLPYAGTSDSVVVGGNASEHLVVFRQGWCSTNADAVADSCYAAGTCANKYNCFDDVTGGMSRNVLALTTVLYTPSTGAIADADMEVIDWGGLPGGLRGTSSGPPDGWYWTCFDPSSGQHACSNYGEDGCYYMDLQNTVTHEAGHFIGLAHPCESDPSTATKNGVPLCSAHPEMAPVTMFPSAQTGETSKRTLEPDDVDGVCTIYPVAAAAAAALVPAEPAATSASAVSSTNAFQCVPRPSVSRSSSGGGCGAGSATPVGMAALALALAILLPRGRRRAGR